MKVIRIGIPNEVECKKCKSLLEYDAIDVFNKEDCFRKATNEHGFCIICPVCGKIIEVQ